MYLLPFYFTTINFLIHLFFGKNIGIKGACFITTFFIFVSLVVSCLMFYEVVICETTTTIKLMSWVHFDFINIDWYFTFDSLTTVMFIVVLFVSFCAHMYSVEYMNGDPHQVRFMSYLSLFTFFMLILVSAGNLIQLFVGWEGVGICSYLLINYWYTRLKANKAAMMAVITNKIGDLALMVAFGYFFYLYKSFDFNIAFSFAEAINIINTSYATSYIEELLNINYIICYLFILGAVGKSAQIGLHIWLPEAMEGPTPVSSLIHAATMVTAGIFLILRCSFIFNATPEVLLWIVFFGSITTFFASSIGVFQNDLKKIIAYSTCSQLGYMFLACGLSGYEYSMFHLFNHAFFKALLFLTAGYIIHSLANEQDIRKMGGLLKLLPFPYMMITIASLSLIGLPFLSGFYSKDKIVELFANKYSLSLLDISNYNFYYVFQLVASVAIICTCTYSMKLLAMVFYNQYNGFYKYLSNIHLTYFSYLNRTTHSLTSISNIHYGNWFLVIPLCLLLLLSIFSGFLFKDILIGNNVPHWVHSLSFTSSNPIIYENNYYFYLLNYEFNEYVRSVTFYWVFYYLIINILFLKSSYQLSLLYIMLSNTYLISTYFILVEKYMFFNKLIVDTLSDIIFYLSYFVTYLIFDKGIIEKLTAFGLFTNLKRAVLSLRGVSSTFTTVKVFYLFVAYLIIWIIVLM